MKLVLKILVGIVIFSCAFVYFAPASLIQKFLPNEISVSGVSGTVWNGNLQTIVFDQVGIQNTKWSSNPLSLLTGKLQADISIDSNNLKGNLETSYSGTKIRAEDVLLDGDLSLLMPYFEKFGLTISGKFNANFNSLEVENGLPKQADGVLNTYNTNILGVFPLNLGDITGIFEDRAQGMLIKVENSNGELDLNGAITVDENGNYLADMNFSKNSETSDQVIQTIQLLGTKISEDTVKMTHSGQLRI
ncbi:MAG: type II secretion system protein N [Gammaproteobacteria bacterium]